MADISITAANFLPSSVAQTFTGTAGATITQGQPVYLNTVTQTYQLCNANTTGNGVNICAGIAMDGASNQQRFLICRSDQNLALGGTVNSGDVVIVSGNAGGMTLSSSAVTGWYVTVLGVGIGNNSINFSMVGSNLAK